MAPDADEVSKIARGRDGPEKTSVVDDTSDPRSIDTPMGHDPAMAATMPALNTFPETGASAHRPGHHIDRYELVEQIGAGGMGVVWSALDVDLGREVALKLIRSASWPLPRTRTRLLREARAMARLSHPNVLTVHDVGTTDEGLFIAMERVVGSTLREWCRSEARSWPEVMSKFIAAGRGLAEAHRAGLVHRDFKPENVLVGKDGVVRVSDFGLARPVGEESIEMSESGVGDGERRLTQQGTLIGTPAYMAPEQLLGQKVTARSDQFSFCLSLWEALYGRRPFQTTEAARAGVTAIAEIMRARSIVDPPAGTTVPDRIEQALRRGLATDPEKRWPDLESLLAELEGSRPRRRLKPVLIASTLVGLVAVSAMVVQIGKGSSPPDEGAAKVEQVSTSQVPTSPRDFTSAPWTPVLVARHTPASRAAMAALAPDGEMIALSSGTKLWTQPRGGGVRSNVPVPPGLVVEEIAFGADANALLLSGKAAVGWETWSTDLSGARRRKITTQPGRHMARMSRDGKRLLISDSEVRREGPATPTIVDLDSGAVHHLGDDESLSRCTWSPDDRAVACIALLGSGSRSESDVVLFDVAAGARKRVARVPGFSGMVGFVEWPAIDRLLVCIQQSAPPRAVLQEWALDNERNLIGRRQRYATSQYVGIVGLQAAGEDVLFSSSAYRGATAIMDLADPVPAKTLQLLDTGSLTDSRILGFTGQGDLLMLADMGGGEDVLRLGRGGQPEVILRADASSEVIALYQDDIWVQRHGANGCERIHYNARGAMAAVAGPCVRGRVLCAHHRNPSCLVISEDDRQLHLYPWDTGRGMGGHPVYSRDRLSPGGEAALAFDGSRLAIGDANGFVEIVDLSTGRVHRAAETGHDYQATAWGRDRVLYAARSGAGSDQELVRIDPDGRVEVLLSHPTRLIVSMRVSPDGRRLALNYRDGANEHWLVENALTATPPR